MYWLGTVKILLRYLKLSGTYMASSTLTWQLCAPAAQFVQPPTEQGMGDGGPFAWMRPSSPRCAS